MRIKKEASKNPMSKMAWKKADWTSWEISSSS